MSTMDDIVNTEEIIAEISEEECLKTRKWWCFLLSSICTFLMGILSVLFVRAFAAIFCTKVKATRNNSQAILIYFSDGSRIQPAYSEKEAR